MTRKLISAVVMGSLIALGSGQALAASAVNINSPEWLGGLKLEGQQLSKIKEAVEKALVAPIDSEQQCGEVRLDCVVRAAREWSFGGNTYREIVVNIHEVGHSSRAVAQKNGKWPAIVAK